MATIDSPNSDEAAELFLRLLVAEAYDGAVEGTALILEKGPPGRKPSQDLSTLHRWFRDLDDKSRECVLAIIRHVSEATLFHCLVLLDGLAGYVMEGKVSDFAVYLQTYETNDARSANSPETRVRLNPAHTTEYLHDRCRWILQEHRGSATSKQKAK